MPRQYQPPGARPWNAGWPDRLGVSGLAPIPPGRTIRRPGLEALLREAARGRLSVLCAGPGWGKTIAVAGWLTAERAGPAAAWVTASASTNDPASFWLEVLQALRRAEGIAADHPLASVSVSAGVPDPAMTAILAAVDALPTPIVLVVDDPTGSPTPGY